MSQGHKNKREQNDPTKRKTETKQKNKKKQNKTRIIYRVKRLPKGEGAPHTEPARQLRQEIELRLPTS